MQVRKKPKEWIPDAVWLNIVALSNMDAFRDIPDSVFRNDGLWRQWYDQEAPEMAKVGLNLCTCGMLIVSSHTCATGDACLWVTPPLKDPKFRFLDQSYLCDTCVFYVVLAPFLQVPDYEDRLSKFERMCVVKTFREDRTLVAASDYISDALGQRFVESVPLNMERAWAESHKKCPLICLLSPGEHAANRCLHCT